MASAEAAKTKRVCKNCRKVIKKLLIEFRSQDSQSTEVWLTDKELCALEIPQIHLNYFRKLTRLVMAHNQLRVLPDDIRIMSCLTVLNLANNQLSALPQTIGELVNLRILNVSFNRLDGLPEQLGKLKQLQILDVSYNNLNETNTPTIWCLDSLRALYASDNDFELLPKQIKQMKQLQILVLRDNDLIALPGEIGELQQLRELHLQNNRLQFLPPELGYLNWSELGQSQNQVLLLEGNPYRPELGIKDQLELGTSHVVGWLKSETYRQFYATVMSQPLEPPPKADKKKKASRADK